MHNRMTLFYLENTNNKRVAVRPDLYSQLVKTIQDYLKDKRLVGPGDEGRKRALNYLKYIEKYHNDLNDSVLFYHVLNDVRQPVGTGTLGSSTLLRSLLAEALCQSIGVSLTEIKQTAKAEFMADRESNDGLTYAEIYLNVLLDTIKRLEGYSYYKSSPASK